MIMPLVDMTHREEIDRIGRKARDGNALSRDEALWLLGLEERTDIFDLLTWSNRIREAHHGNRIRLCSIVNVKAGGCAEDCKFCAQSASYQTASPRYGFIDTAPVLQAAEEAAANGVASLGIVAAWKGLNEGPMLDAVCDRLQALKAQGKVAPDASLGLIADRRVAERLAEAGLKCYNHNLETSRRFFPEQCSTHGYDDRVQTIRHLKAAGIRVCSGGILGLGESREDRCDLALALRELEVDVVPVNILNPIEGTPYAQLRPLAPLEALKTIAVFRLLLPRQEILVAGGRAINLRDLQGLIFMAGASALMVGNYLTTVNRSVEEDLQMIRDLGLEPEV
ncbi:MAG: biotin synthase BioB [Verrucomicrobiales bacterium]|nr:biotin synthase BioB [Verrucomicrobiales bacterium]